MSAAARCLDDGCIGLWIHYDYRSLAKEIPGAQWDGELKCWRIPPQFAFEAHDVADLINQADVEASVQASLQRLLVALPSEMRAPTWRALALAWHPDHGGDPRVMRALLAERVAS